MNALVLVFFAMLACSTQASSDAVPATCKMGQQDSACSEQAAPDGDDALSLLQVQAKLVTDIEGDQAEDEGAEEGEEDPEEEYEYMPEEKRMALQQLFDGVEKHTVGGGRESPCPARHYLAGLKVDGDTVSADCMPCAGHCEVCYGPTQRECLACSSPMVTLLTREFPHPIFACVSACPECYTADENNNCLLDQTCSVASEEEEVYEPLNHTISEFGAIEESGEPEEPEMPSLLEVKDGEPKEPEEPVEDPLGLLQTEGSRRRSTSGRRRRGSRRRSKSGGGDCQGKIVKIQEEIDAWYDDCYDAKAKFIKNVCDEWKSAKKKIKKFRKITKAAKAGSSSSVQSALKALGFLPWGVGKILKAISKTLKIIHPKAKSADTATKNFETKLNSRHFEKGCKKNDKLRKKVKTAHGKVQKVLDGAHGACGCNCLSDNGAVDRAVAKSQEYLNLCTYWPDISLPTIPSLSIPSIIEDILDFIPSLVSGLNSVLGTWIWIPFWGWETLGSIVKALSWALGFVDWMVEKIIFGLLSAIGIGCSSMSSCLNSLIGKYLDKIPGLSFPYSISWNVEWTLSHIQTYFPRIEGWHGMPLGLPLPGCATTISCR